MAAQTRSRSAEMGGQTALPIDGESPQRIDLTKQQNFADVAKPQLFGVEPRHLEAGDLHRIHLLASERLLPDLINVPRTSEHCVRYYNPDTSKTVHVALAPEEYTAITISPGQLGRKVVNRTLASRPPRGDFTEDQAAAQRSGVHAITGRLAKMEKYITQLEADQDLIKRFSEYVSHPHMRRLRGDNLVEQMAWLREHVLGSVFTVLREQRGWEPDQLAAAQRAMDDRLFLDRRNNQHLKNWQDTLKMTDVYWGYKLAVFKDRAHAARQEIRRRQPK